MAVVQSVTLSLYLVFHEYFMSLPAALFVLQDDWVEVGKGQVEAEWDQELTPYKLHRA